MPKESASLETIREAQRGLAWALLLSLAILGGIVALLTGFTLLRLLPHAGLLAASSDFVTLPTGERLHPAWFRMTVVAFAVSLGLGVASVWGLLWLRRAWEPPAASAKPQPKSAQKSPSRKKRKR
ncbi:MAG: hypothetical protein NZN28_07330 [Meiothermus sp.]|uniref:hypothetical protein n=1 Tax=Meiothermus sp. TaxID=1955249 RepID=UPI0025DD459D|nr:hypothetical protein [Meiothermus sp.]MCS7068426.1 hypothetical protein [Meiothermus sp.]